MTSYPAATGVMLKWFITTGERQLSDYKRRLTEFLSPYFPMFRPHG